MRPKARLYLVATSHLDSQWRWTIQTTIRHFLRRTLQDNFARFDEFPSYVLSFEGAFRYQLIQEYYPKEFLELQDAVRQGRWRLAGSMLDAPDTNLPSPESLIRHFLYGNDYFERQFGRRSEDVFLPDCFGFPWSLPTIAAHCGLRGFSSQKFIKWIRPSRIPFDLGIWEGPDGSRIVAVLDPGGYGEALRQDLSRSREWRERLERRGHDRGLAVGYRYFGVGDRGGAPDATSLDWLTRSLEDEGDIEVVHTGSDQLFRDLETDELERLPVHRGDLLLPTHGTGCWTSQVILKTWNRNCEILAGATETAAVAAGWLGGSRTRGAELAAEWTRFLWHQMHDDITGTSSPEAYRFSWNDLCLAQNRFSSLLRDSVAEVARGLDTSSDGMPLVVFNSLGFAREELVDAWVEFESETAGVRVVAPDGREIPCQKLEHAGHRVRILFSARLPPVGIAVYQAIPAEEAPNMDSELAASDRHLENENYRVEVSDSGAIESVFDKRLDRELLAAPIDLVLLPDHSSRWPAWEIRHRDLSAPEVLLEAPAEIRVAENGPVRVALEIVRRAGDSSFRQRVSLAAGGAGKRLEITNDVDWRSRATLLKARFPIAVEKPTATYDLGLGMIERGINRPEQHEVPAHEWADLSEASWGVSILSSARYGWDRPSAGTLRLSLLRSPKAFRRFAHQAVQDLGRHRFRFAISSHCGPPGTASVTDAAAFGTPPFPFQSALHHGTLGREFSLLAIEGEGLHLMALKQAEADLRWMARLREVRGTTSRATLKATAAIESASSVDGCERNETSLEVSAGAVELEQSGFSLGSYLLSPAASSTTIPDLESAQLELDFDAVATSFHGVGGVDFDGRGQAIPGELFPDRVRAAGLDFALGFTAPRAPNALSCRGQTLKLPVGDCDRLHLLAASTREGGSEGPALWTLPGDSKECVVRVPFYSGFIGQWKSFSGRFAFLLGRMQPGFLERTPVAWVASHLHDRKGRDLVYTFGYLFLLELAVPRDASAITLPEVPEIKLFGAVVSNAGHYALRPAKHLYE